MLPALSLIPLPFLLALGIGLAPSQDPVEAVATPKIEDFAWLAGQWRGKGFDGTCEEIWSEPLGGTMVGTFRLVKDGQVVFYEIMVLGPDDEGFALKVKHFSKEFVSWEDKQGAVRFAFDSVKENDARFSGLSLVRDADELEVKVKMRVGGETRWQPIQMKRHPPPKR